MIKYYPATFVFVAIVRREVNFVRKYETMFILSPDLVDEDVNDNIEKIKKIFDKSNSEIENIDSLGKKKLSYEINKKTEGYFVLINFMSDEKFPKELDRNFKIMDAVIRHIIVRKN